MMVDVAVEIKEVDFDGLMSAVDRWAGTDVHHAENALPVDQTLGYIHAVGRDKFVGFGYLYVGRWIANGAAQLFSGGYCAG